MTVHNFIFALAVFFCMAGIIFQLKVIYNHIMTCMVMAWVILGFGVLALFVVFCQGELIINMPLDFFAGFCFMWGALMCWIPYNEPKSKWLMLHLGEGNAVAISRGLLIPAFSTIVVGAVWFCSNLPW